MKCKQFLKSCSRSAFSAAVIREASQYFPGEETLLCSHLVLFALSPAQCLPRAGCGEEFRVCVEEALWFQELQESLHWVVFLCLRQGAAVGLGLGKVDKNQIFNSGGPNLQLCRIIPMWRLCSAFWEDPQRFPPAKPCTLCSQSTEQSSPSPGWESPTGKLRNP